jgi:hypothetical protein
VTTPTASYDRLDAESDPAWEAFSLYRELPPRDRSQAEVAKRLRKSKQLIGRWASRYAWLIRAAAYDRHMDHLWQQEVVHRRRTIAERDLGVAGLMLNKVVQRLQSIDANTLTARDLATWVTVATQVARLALGEPTSTIQVSGKEGAPVDIEALTPEERRARLKDLIREATKRAQEGSAAS